MYQKRLAAGLPRPSEGLHGMSPMLLMPLCPISEISNGGVRDVVFQTERCTN